MPNPDLRGQLRAREPTLGCYVGLGSPAVAELLAHVGFDWLVLEAEHTAVDIAQVENMLRAVSASDTAAIVRVPAGRPDFVQLALDAGADGILVPLVRTAAEAQAIVEATRFPPEGTRSFGPLRASRYYAGTREYFRRANEQTVVALIIETKEALANLAEIAAVPGVDALYLGPKDLALALGLDPFDTGSGLVQVEARLAAVCGAAGIAAGNGAASSEDIAVQIARGFTMIGYGPDYRLLSDSAREGVAAFRSRP